MGGVDNSPGGPSVTEVSAGKLETSEMAAGIASYRKATAVLRVALFAPALAGCGAAPVITDVRNDQVQVQANGANLGQAQAKAQEACNLRSGVATLVNYRCDDNRCLQGTYFFSCASQAK